MSEMNKVTILGPLIIGGLVLVAAGSSVYNVIENNKIKKSIDEIKNVLIENNTTLKNIHVQQLAQASLLKKGGGAMGDNLQDSVVAALRQIKNDEAVQQQAELYKKWGAAGESKDGHYIYGNPTARFTLINYSDLECSFCQKFHTIPKSLVDSAKNGMVNWEWRHFPLSFHEPVASEAAIMGECIAQQKGSKGFWAFTEYWFLRQSFVKSENIPSVFGLDRGEYDTCLKDPSISQKIKADILLGNVAGVTGTPATVVVDNQTGQTELVAGAQPFSKFVQVIDGMAHPEKVQPSTLTK